MHISIINHIQHYHIKIQNLLNMYNVNLINIMIKLKFNNIIKLLINLNMILKYKDKYGIQQQNQIDHIKEDYQVLILIYQLMVQSLKNYQIQVLIEEMYLDKHHSLLLMRIGLLLIHHGIKDHHLNIFYNGKIKGLIDLLLEIIIMVKDINMMYQ